MRRSGVSQPATAARPTDAAAPKESTRIGDYERWPNHRLEGASLQTLLTQALANGTEGFSVTYAIEQFADELHVLQTFVELADGADPRFISNVCRGIEGRMRVLVEVAHRLDVEARAAKVVTP